MRTFAIGDIHGCFDELLRLLEILRDEHALKLGVDRLIFVGDYVDRGPKSFETVRFLRDLQEKHGTELVILLVGNHERMMLDYFRSGKAHWLTQGGNQTLKSFNDNGERPEDWLEYIESFPAYFDDGNVLFVHAGVRPGVPLTEQDPKDLVWIRGDFFNHPAAYHKPVVFGHSPTTYVGKAPEPILLNGNIAIDTACVYGGRLSAAIFEDGKLSGFCSVESGFAFEGD